MSSFHAGNILRVFVASAAFACGLGAAHAALDFDTYVIRRTVERVNVGGKLVDSVSTTYDMTRLGSTSLEASSLTLTSHGSYLSVVEEATLSGKIENRPHDITKDFLFQGSLPIPPLAAVHELSVMHGDTVYQARLKKMIYSLDDSFFDTLALRATLDTRTAFLQQLSDQGFEATFAGLSLGEPVRVRIAYDIPFSGAPGTAVRVPVIFHPSGAPPRQAEITFFEEAKDLPPVQWLSENGRVTLDSKGTHTVGYQESYLFRRDESPKTVVTLQTTGFESGKLKGQYLLFKGGLDDSLMNRLSRPLEVTFLWRWNPPYAFVETQNGLKTLSEMGRLAAQEARAFKQIIQEMSPRGHRFGLMRSAPGFSDDFYAPAEAESDGYQALLAYLDRFTEDRLYADFKDYKDDKPAWAATAWADSGEVSKSRKEFLAALGRIRRSFSDRPEALRHIEMIGMGSALPSLVDLKDPSVIEGIIDSVTVSNVFAPWLGVDMDQALQLKANGTLRPLSIASPLAAGLPPLLFPVFQPTSVEYRAFTATRSHAVVLPFSLNAEREAVIKAEGAFADSLQLQGIDVLGRKTRIYTLIPRMQRSPADSGIARLWAADPDRIAEIGEVDLGLRYGILTKGTYLGAGVSEGKVPGQSNGVAILPKSVRMAATVSFRVDGGMLRIAGLEGPAGSAAQRAPRMDIYDLSGRLVYRLSLEEFRNGAGFAIPIGYFQKFGRHGLVLVLRSAGRMHSFSLSVGGQS